mmetsp:Transcript_5825/g.16861  ORF Transcript_5825/g.16861 Transcript_5825/m.16861 type:complete len:380 (-) Transcript_5825:1266-2405(-)
MSSGSSWRSTNHPFCNAFLTVAWLRSASFTNIAITTGLSPLAEPPSATFANVVTAFQKGEKCASVFAKRLVPYSSCNTTMMEVLRRRISRRAATRSTSAAKLVCRWSSSVCPAKADRTCANAAECCGGASCINTWKSSAEADGSKCRKAAAVLRKSSTPSRSRSVMRGPIVPMTGNMLNSVAAYNTMCSASSILPMPVAPSITTTPPMENGLFFGICASFSGLGGPLGIVIGRLCRSAENEPPKKLCTFWMPIQSFKLQSCATFSFMCAAMSSTFMESCCDIDRGRSYHGSLMPPFTSNPMCVDASLRFGLKMGIGFALPFTLIGVSSSQTTSRVHMPLVASSTKMPSCGALAIRRADKFTASPSTVYSMRCADPQHPQ